MPENVTAIILTFNSAHSVGAVIESCADLCHRIVVVDSFSKDDTEQVAAKYGVEFVQHPFENYAKQRNWAEQTAAIPSTEWVLHLDSDEVISQELFSSIQKALDKPNVNGFLMRRVTFFWKRPIRHGHMNPSWHLRLYRSGTGQCENREYDQHYVCEGPTAKLDGELLDLQLIDLTAWTASHNRWASAEVQEILSAKSEANAEGQLQETVAGDLRMRKRWVKNRVWYKLPRYGRVFLFFLYSYIIKRGFLDGPRAFPYHVLHAFWFRFLVDAKLYEAENGLSVMTVDNAWLQSIGAHISRQEGRLVEKYRADVK